MQSSRWRFNVNIGFTDDDRILIQNLYTFKDYGAKTLSFKLTEQITELFEYFAGFARLFLHSTSSFASLDVIA